MIVDFLGQRTGVMAYALVGIGLVLAIFVPRTGAGWLGAVVTGWSWAQARNAWLLRKRARAAAEVAS